MNELVSVEWLHKNLNLPDLVVIDASLKTTVNRNAANTSLETIPESRYFDLKNNFSKTNCSLPNTLPNQTQFETECQKLGIRQNSKIVVFDSFGIYSSPRVWWLFKAMGHQDISVLNGGLPAWIQKGFQTEIRTSKNYRLGNFKAMFQNKYVKNYQDIIDNQNTKIFTIVDARSEGRFNGSAPEPRKHLKSGHIPDSINLPYDEVLVDGKFKSTSELKKVFDQKCNDKKELVFSCGSGLTACIVMLANAVAFSKSRAVYDGSWTEWAERQNLKIDVL
ncbi:MAG: rhodanese-like domain-containing protein [Flavobacteriaceae bacterium]|jgi:thiosulfate/3-mercaptopyruvate sulfurtransferase|nr:rhodanese-like domain-containing protein [Flavobacteriaceae bacterium]MDA7848922.1 rhodanese-like domain-containing protein [Flavobacteriaceae bacterium]MDG1308883.1 rhodanese-like domain-containing protein [Flavobacteriaceae bacterium]